MFYNCESNTIIMKRRKFLASTVGVGITSTAGCVNIGRSSSMENYDHPSAQNILDRPYLGPNPRESDKLIVSFNDPACPSCADFYYDVFQDLRDKHIETGELTFVYRGVDIVYDWGSMPIRIQRKVYIDKGSEKAFDVIHKYYEMVDNISSDNVLKKSKEILRSLNLNEDKYIPDEKSEEPEFLRENSKIFDTIDVPYVPRMYLFKDKKYQTNLGLEDLSVFESALEL